TEQPGLHFKWPLGIESAERVKADRVEKEEFGFRTLEADVRTRYSAKDYSVESLMLTGDLNQADVEWTVQYKIKDPRAYLFNVRDPQTTLRAISESAMRAVVGDRGVTEVLTVGKAEVESEAEKLLQSILDQYRAGIQIQRVKLQDVFPPEQVKQSFTDVEAAKQEKEETILMAQQGYNQEIPAATGSALKLISEAEGYKLDRVNRARGEAERFSAILAEYQKAPQVTRRRLYLEALADLLPRVTTKVIVDDAVTGLLPLLELGGGKGK
ncbi:MAG: FtsH protease activity modulator HflK, partial [Planctomycetes bacterium]|nr:FtsH protease activity modulator HflK [Planctomycetota bacterium]